MINVTIEMLQEEQLEQIVGGMHGQLSFPPDEFVSNELLPSDE